VIRCHLRAWFLPGYPVLRDFTKSGWRWNFGCPILRVCCEGWAKPRYTPAMPTGLKRFFGAGDLHFLTFSCHGRRAYLKSPAAKDVFLSVLEEVCQQYSFPVIGFVVMPEHVHLLAGEPDTGTPSLVMQVLKQRTARKLKPVREQAFWQAASMTSTSGRRRSAWRNCAICIAIPLLAAWLPSRNIGSGAVFATIDQASAARSRSIPDGVSSGNGMKNPTLRNGSEGWGTRLSIKIRYSLKGRENGGYISYDLIRDMPSRVSADGNLCFPTSTK
jgi:REP element-mobilizing transposase RayT